MIKFIYPYLILLFFISCKKDKLEGNKEILIGKWQWTYTDHSFGWCENENWEETLTPASESTQYSLEFEKRGIIKFFEETELVEESRIVFDYYEINSDGESYFLFYLNNDESRPISGGGGDTLRLRYPYSEQQPGCENYKNYFVKE